MTTWPDGPRGRHGAPALLGPCYPGDAMIPRGAAVPGTVTDDHDSAAVRQLASQSLPLRSAASESELAADKR